MKRPVRRPTRPKRLRAGSQAAGGHGCRRCWLRRWRAGRRRRSHTAGCEAASACRLTTS